jgi:hypothetical protein
MSYDDSETFVQIYSKLAATLGLGGTSPGEGGSIFSIMIPGLFITPNLDIHSIETQYYLASFLDRTMRCSWLAQQGSGSVAGVYKTILDSKETPLVKLTEEEKLRLHNAEDLLYLPDGGVTNYFREYLDCQYAYYQAQDAYNQAAATQQNGGPPIPTSIIEARDRAASDWNNREIGHRHEVDEALAIIKQYQSFEPERYWKDLMDEYRNHTLRTRDSSEFQPLDASPPYNTWFTEFGWIDFSFDEADRTRQTRAGGVGIGGSLPPDYRLSQSLPADTEVAVWTPVETQIENLRIRCKLKRVDILRRWLDPFVFPSRAWRWSPASIAYGTEVSTGGNIAAGVIPAGVMPVVPMVALLARDLDIKWDDAPSLSTIAALDAQRHHLALGPFRIDGMRVENGHIYKKDPQLLGFILEILGKSPNPDPKLPWPVTSALLPPSLAHFRLPA